MWRGRGPDPSVGGRCLREVSSEWRRGGLRLRRRLGLGRRWRRHGRCARRRDRQVQILQTGQQLLRPARHRLSVLIEIQLRRPPSLPGSRALLPARSLARAALLRRALLLDGPQAVVGRLGQHADLVRFVVVGDGVVALADDDVLVEADLVVVVLDELLVVHVLVRVLRQHRNLPAEHRAITV